MARLRYYDVVLIAIAASLGAGVGVGIATPVAMSIAVPAFGLLAIAMVGHALFVNGPVDDVDDLKEDIDPEKIPGGEVVAGVVD